MKLAIMQPYFFPYIGYFQLIAAVDKFIIYDDVNFINRGWINRNNLLINGKAGLISVPLNGASQNKRIKDIAPVSDQKWRITLLKTIEQNYKKAPHFDVVYPMLIKVIDTNASTISEFNYQGINAVCTYLGISTTLIPSSELYANNELKGQYRILDICLKEKAHHYINPSGGMELYNREVFSNEGISLSFIKSELPRYNQFGFEFIPALSIIDVVMFCEPKYIKESLLKAYGLL
jgi:hypothetical protein